jgi:ABC-type bacteriocin/lantibiotic exporter with double-glycine peptidase domain
MVSRIQKSAVVLSCLCSFLCAAQSSPIWIDVPFVKQERNGCGAASVAMLMQYWQRQQGKANDTGADVTEIQRLLYSERVHGIYAADLERYLGQHGFRTFAFPGSWSDLKHHLAKGRPLIAALKPQARGERHYVVVAGLDTVQNLVLVNDPAQRKLLEREWSQFESEWRATGNWTLLAVPREDAPPIH